MEITKTQKKILSKAKKEFLKKGFQEASLNEIVKQAGFTKGAFYGYYENKEILFNTIVEEKMNKFIELISNRENKYCDSENCINTICELIGCNYIKIVEYIYENYDEFKLVLIASNGTKYNNFVHQIVEKRINIVENSEYMDEITYHMIISGYFTGLFEIVLHDMKKEQAIKYAKNISDFFTAGIKEISKRRI